MTEVTKEQILEAEAALAADIREFYADPLGHVMYSYPWDSYKPIQLVPWGEERYKQEGFKPLPARFRDRFNAEFGPDEWACEMLDEIGEEVYKRKFDGANRVDPMLFTNSTGHGTGKTTMAAWLGRWIMDTRPLCRITVTANTDTQLRTKTWAAVEFWHNIGATKHWYDLSTGRGAMALRHKQNPGTWFMSAQTSREENSEAFAGQHAASSSSVYIFDEASAIPNKIYEVRKGGLVTGEPMVFDFGNPTRNSGAFYEENVGKEAHRYIVRSIDSRKAWLSNKKLLAEWLEDCNGNEDDDFYRVRVRGLFPRKGSGQFVKTGDVEAAQRRPVAFVKGAHLVIGVDCSGGGEHETVIYPRVGMDARSFGCERHKNHDGTFIAGRVIEMVRKFRAMGVKTKAIVVDDTGGYGSGVITVLRNLGYNVFAVKFSHGPTDKERYRFKGDEMWGRMRTALGESLAILEPGTPDGDKLKDQLTQREYTMTANNRIWLEPKKVMQKRLNTDASPDIGDALALTFFEEIIGVDVPEDLADNGIQTFAKSDYDPYDIKD
jgi:hypothetical protein